MDERKALEAAIERLELELDEAWERGIEWEDDEVEADEDWAHT